MYCPPVYKRMGVYKHSPEKRCRDRSLTTGSLAVNIIMLQYYKSYSHLNP